jgi:hypothetical protein
MYNSTNNYERAEREIGSLIYPEWSESKSKLQKELFDNNKFDIFPCGKPKKNKLVLEAYLLFYNILLSSVGESEARAVLRQAKLLFPHNKKVKALLT